METIMRLLGILDIVGAVLLLGVGFHLEIPTGLIVAISIYLIGKALLFIKDIGSWFDIFGGILLLLSFIVNIPIAILVVAALLIGSKGILTLFI